MPKYFAPENDNCLKIYFRIPLTMYFVGKCRHITNTYGLKSADPWSKLYLFTKEWDGGAYIWVRLTGMDLNV